ncbi:phage tail protein I [Microbulbifer thermotolerans]|uniref:phage tail protein I n=1 Tax=Microbulbifer thermotolerans TaxID=252514 RepID=UPI00224B2B3A|nr:phage tail protein I [Microbulbifer thermotolerans]MCX2834451.1 phage tail protein I [Microbulbifer thermotolerans]
MIELKLPFWLSGPQLSKLQRAAQRFWQKVEDWLYWPVRQLDPETCTPGVLDLLAWERSVSRFSGEPMHLYRLRVKHAFINAKDAGSVAGMRRIFERLQIGYVEIQERLTDRDWDVVRIHLSDAQLADNPDLLMILLRQYGRTCRRYEFEVLNTLTVQARIVHCGHDNGYLAASL